MGRALPLPTPDRIAEATRRLVQRALTPRRLVRLREVARWLVLAWIVVGWVVFIPLAVYTLTP